MKVLFLFAVIFIAGIHAIPVDEKVARCADMPKDSNKDHTKMLEQNSMKTYIYVSNKPDQESCLSLGYNTYKQGDLPEGSAIMYNPMLQPSGFRVNVILNELPGNFGWKVFGGEPTMVDFFVTIFNMTDNILCAYTCDKDGEKINNFRCIAKDEQGLSKIVAAIQPKIGLWPFKADSLPMVTYSDTCRSIGTNAPKKI